MKPLNLQPKAMNDFFSRFRRPILLIAALIVLIIGYFAVLAEPIRIYQENFALLGELNNDISVAAGDLQTSKSFSSKIYKLTPLESKLLEMALPAKLDDSSLVAQISSMAKKAGFSVGNIDLEETNGVAGSKTNASQIGKISVNLKLKGGGYGELKQLLELMESSLLMIDVYSINFTAKSSVYDLSLVAYYYDGSAGAKN